MVIVALALALLVSLALADESRPGESYVSVEWRADPNEGGRKIVAHYTYRGYVCQYRFHRASARETRDAVTIKVLAHRRELRSDEACIAVLGGGDATVKLREPLGDRELRHAPVNDR